jgi:hypothetical protein
MWTMHDGLLVVRCAATRIGRCWSHDVVRCQGTRRDQRPNEQRGQDDSFKRDRKRESFAAKPARSHSRGGIIVNQAFRQASEIAHGHTSTHHGWQPFCKSVF